MSSNFDIFRTAKLYVAQFGKEAPIRAGKRAEQLYRSRDFAGCVYWLRTLTLIYELLTRELRDNRVLH